MTQEIRVPEVSEGVTEGKVISVSVGVGDRVEADQTLLELETDKAVVAIPSPFDGQITDVSVADGDTVQVGQVIMVGEPADESAGDSAAGAAGTAAEPASTDIAAETEPAVGTEPPVPEPEAPAEPASAMEAPPPQPAEPPPAATSPPTQSPPVSAAEPDLATARSGDEVAPAAPAIRRLARELGVDIYQVPGSGPGGRISADDVRGFVQQTMQRLSGGTAAATAGPARTCRKTSPCSPA